MESKVGSNILWSFLNVETPWTIARNEGMKQFANLWIISYILLMDSIKQYNDHDITVYEAQVCWFVYKTLNSALTIDAQNQQTLCS